jgi:demethylmenaquinone methyltransferase/2-methoxy-6-polyprenyl-1,4-benzoquinol methylase
LEELIVEDRKAKFVEDLFSGIPKEYDLLLSILTLHQDSFWRNYTVVNSCIPARNGKLLDIATGTGILAYRFKEVFGNSILVIGLDITREMVKVAKENNNKRKRKKDSRDENIEFVVGRAEALPFREDRFDAVTISLAMRNVSSVDATLSEMTRVIKEKGRVISLDFRKPSNRAFRFFYYFYLFRVMPFIGGFISNNWERTFQYLARSIDRSLKPEQIKSMMKRSGLRKVGFVNLTGGVVALVLGTDKKRERRSPAL